MFLIESIFVMLNNLKVEKITSYFVRAKHKILLWWTTMSSRIWTSMFSIFKSIHFRSVQNGKKKHKKLSSPRPSVARQPPDSAFLRGRPTHRPISPLRLVGMGWTQHVMSSHCLTEPFVSFLSSPPPPYVSPWLPDSSAQGDFRLGAVIFFPLLPCRIRLLSACFAGRYSFLFWRHLL